MQIVDTDVWRSLLVDCIGEMIALAKRENVTARQELNGVVVMVNGDSDRQLIYRDQQRAMSKYIDGPVGPYPKERLTSADLASDAAIDVENEKHREERRKQYEVEATAKREAFNARLESAPEFALIDKAVWDEGLKKNPDYYGRGVYVYAERWARLMQAEMAAGKNLADIAGQTSHDADVDGITGFMYGCAVSILAKCWAHGEELRRWHNKDTQIGTEGDRANEAGGVLNPALISLG